MEVRRKRSVKSIPLKKRQSINIEKLNYQLFSIILLEVFRLLLEDGKIQYNRKTCPSCGPGLFMAKHWDRYYCGSCHTTIKMDA